GIRLVVHQHFPVAVMQVTQHAASDFKPAFRRTVHHIVYGRQRFTKKILERFTFGIQAAEYEAAILAHILHGSHALAGFTLLEHLGIVSLLERNREQLAIGLERPGVIGAAKELARIAAGARSHLHTLVRATIVKHSYGLISVPDQHHGLVAHR